MLTTSGRPPSRTRYALPASGITGVLLTLVGISGVGDTPDPHDPAASMAAYFLRVRHDVFVSAPIVYAGAGVLLAFLVGLARRLHRAGEAGAAIALASGGVVVCAYFAGLELVYTSLSYQVAATSAEATKALFTLTILASPVLGAGTAAVLLAGAMGVLRCGLLARWWVVLTAAGAAVAGSALVAYSDSGVLYPDAQQQSASTVLLLWVLVTSCLLARPIRHPRHRDVPVVMMGP